MSSKHIRYAVRLAGHDGLRWVGSKAFSYRSGKYARETDFAHARLFTREQDAISAVSLGDEVIPVVVHLPGDNG